jgi:alkylation response protein AidB-like acyl-CoA dehydrogenase
MKSLELAHFELPESTLALRQEVRKFLKSELEAGSFVPQCDSWNSGHSASFSQKLAMRGWLGMTWPRQYGGHERSALERFVVVEELLAAGAPVAAHWPTDRQVGPSILRYGSDEQRRRFLPAMARGECFFAVGMSEPDSGSDLASVRTRADRSDGHWVVNGSKVWTTHAHHCHYIILLLRTSTVGNDRHAGLSQMIIDLTAPGVTIRPILLISGEHRFNEVIFEDAAVNDDMVLGEVGDGWRQVTGELSVERSGPERYMSVMKLLLAFLNAAGLEGGERAQVAAGELIAQMWTLREMSLAVAGALDRGEEPAVEAALVKDLGTRFDRELIDVVRRALSVEPALGSKDHLASTLADAIMVAPGFTLRGGTTEILRSVIVKGLEL